MSTAVAPVAAWRASAADEGQIWLYIAKTVVALYLTAWLAMRLEMPSPSTAMITVLIVMNRQPGLVLAKAFYRGLGTVVGCAGGVAIVALFPQQPVLLLAAMALWAGGMAAGALVNRNMRAYSFVLAGYTVAMIVLPSVNHPTQVFDTAVWRLTEVMLGLVVASCVFDVAWPTRLRTPLLGMQRANANELLATLAGVCAQPAQGAALLRAAGARAVAYEDLRSTAFFDDPSLRAADAALRALNQRYLAVISAAKRLALASTGERHPAPLQALSALLEGATADDAELAAKLQAWRQDHSDATSAAHAAAERLVQALLGYLAAYQQLDVDRSHALPLPTRRALPFVRVTDPVAVQITFVRAAGLMFVMGLLWMASGWDSGGTALFGIVALLSMLSAAPDPVAVTKQICIGHTLAPLFALGCYSLLPILPTFSLLVLGSLPFMLVILRVAAHPPVAFVGVALNMGFMVALSLGLAPKVNPQFYLNDALAISIGAVLVLVGFMLFPNVTGSRGQRRRLLRLLRGQVGVAARARLATASARFDSRGHDLLRQIHALTRPGSAAARRLDDWMLQVHEAGMTVIELRQWRAAQPGVDRAVDKHLDNVIAQVAALYAKPSPKARQQAFEAIDAAYAHAVDSAPLQALLARLRHVLMQGHRALRAPAGSGEVADAV